VKSRVNCQSAYDNNSAAAQSMQMYGWSAAASQRLEQHSMLPVTALKSHAERVQDVPATAPAPDCIQQTDATLLFLLAFLLGFTAVAFNRCKHIA
jgi:hypothetical protein